MSPEIFLSYISDIFNFPIPNLSRFKWIYIKQENLGWHNLYGDIGGICYPRNVRNNFDLIKKTDFFSVLQERGEVTPGPF